MRESKKQNNPANKTKDSLIPYDYASVLEQTFGQGIHYRGKVVVCSTDGREWLESIHAWHVD